MTEIREPGTTCYTIVHHCTATSRTGNIASFVMFFPYFRILTFSSALVMGNHKKEKTEKKEKKENHKHKSRHDRKTNRYIWVIDQV